MKKSLFFVLLALLITTVRLPAQVYNWTTISGLYNTPAYADGTNNAAFFNNPNGMAVDGMGNVYVVDAGNYAIRKLSQNGSNWVATTIAGKAGVRDNLPPTDGSNSAARFFNPLSITLDGNGNLFVCDIYNYNYNKIRKVSPVGTNWVVTTIYSSFGGSSSSILR